MAFKRCTCFVISVQDAVIHSTFITITNSDNKAIDNDDDFMHVNIN